MTKRQYYAAHGGGGGGAGSRLPKFAQDIAGLLFRDPEDAFRAQGGQFGPTGTGIFGDIASGYNAGNADRLFGGLTPGIDASQMGRDYFGRNAINLTDRGLAAGMNLNDMAYRGAQNSATYNDLVNSFMDQSGRGFNTLMGFLGQNGPATPDLVRQYGLGQVGREALNASRNVGPDSELYKSTLSFLTPQVRSAFAARGMGSSGAALGAEGDQARQLADTFAQRAQQERNAFLQTAGQSEATNAGFQSAINNALANMYGTQGGLLGAKIQGALGAAEAPGRIFSTYQGGLGQGIQNMGAALGQYLQPLQINQAGLAGLGQALNLPLAYQQGLYNYLRSPQTQLLGIPSSTGQQSLGGHPNGLLGDILGFEKGG